MRTGHKYGAHFVLYEGPPDECHSRYCVHVAGGGGGDSWGHMKTVTRLMPVSFKCRPPGPCIHFLFSPRYGPGTALGGSFSVGSKQ